MSLRVAVIGGGIAGLSAAHELSRDVDTTLFEADDDPGGHACTVHVPDEGATLGMDTAFVVFNETHYPQVTRFFAHLGVPTQPHAGRFNFFDLDTGVDYVSEDFDRTADEIRSLYPPEFAHLWEEATRFHREGPHDFLRKRTDVPLGEYLDRNGYSESFKYGFVVLIATAAWSVPAERIWEMPASTVIAFFLAHGAEGLGGRAVPWRTVTGGSARYVDAAVRSLRAAGAEVRTGTPVREVDEDSGAVAVRTADGTEWFDRAVVATHADEALALVQRPTDQQRRLEAVRYHTTKAVLHTDASVLPADRNRWRSWNYGRDTHGGRQRSWVAYYLNMIQDFEASDDYFVTLDCPRQLRDERVIEEISYRHPIFDQRVRDMQSDIQNINADSRVKFAGSYFHARKLGPDIIGSHESAFDSGIAAAEAVRRELAGHVPA